ncbi:MAG: nitroreductase family protein [Planctomycetota bacterium]|nr:nitroreductase family protein [Planctomycetota bacterium]
MGAEHTGYRFVPLEFRRYTPEEMLARAHAFVGEIQRRRSVRHFSDEPLPEGLVDACIRAAGSAPSGAHRQPWTFVVVTDPDVKHEIRIAAEKEEKQTYESRLTEEWREALEPLGTDWQKPFLETAPALVAVFRQSYGVEEQRRRTNYYTTESVGIATGFLLAALHHAGLATLTHTPSPMGFLREVLRRPENEKAFVLIPVGYPTEGCLVPDLARKALDEIRVRV